MNKELEFSDLEGVEIFATGVWNNQEFTTKDLDEIVENTNRFLKKGTNKPPLKFGHSKKQIMDGQTDGDPALGWIDVASGLKRVGNKIIANFTNVPTIVKKAIEKRLYDKVSVEMRFSTEAGYIIKAVSLLGADLPAVKTLDDLSLFLASEDNEEANKEICFDLETESNKKLPIEKEKMTEEVKQVSIQETAEFKEIKSKNEDLEKIVQEFREKENKALFSSKKEEVISAYKKDSEKGILMPAILEKIEHEIDSQLGNFSEGSEILFSASLVREIAQSYSETLPKGESADGQVKEPNADASVEFAEKVQEVRDSSGKTYSEATEIVKRKHPELVKQLVNSKYNK